MTRPCRLPVTALAARLHAEDELERLQAARTAPRVAPIAVNVRKRCLEMDDDLERILLLDPDRGRGGAQRRSRRPNQADTGREPALPVG